MKKTKVMSLLALGTLLVFGLAVSVAFAKNDKSSNGDKGGSSSAKSEKTKELKNYEKPTATKTNAVIHKEKIDKVATELKGVANEEKNKGNQQNKEENALEKKNNNPETGEQEEKKMKERAEIADELEEIAEETEATEDETVEAIEEVEEESGFKKFFLGADYKNLGQLRSSLVHNENQVRKLTKLSGATTDEETKIAIDEQLTTLMQERERIKNVISENEEGFSLLGWVFRFMNGYTNGDVDDEGEVDLEEDVVEVVEGDDLGGDADEVGDESEGEAGDNDEDTGEEESGENQELPTPETGLVQ